MQNSLGFVILSLFLGSISFAEIKMKCHNENTFVEISEVAPQEDGQKVAELIVNLKELNRILNLPEVLVQSNNEGLSINKATEAFSIDLNLNVKSVNLSVNLDEKSIRDRVSMECE